MEDKKISDYFDGLMLKTKAEIQTIESCEGDILIICQKTLYHLQDVLAELKQFVLSYQFEDNAEEIRFFKEMKPQIVCYLIYYNSLYAIELKCPNGSEDVVKLYYSSELDRLTDYFDSNLNFYQYYRTNATYLDEKYFLRGKHDIHIIIDSNFFDYDPQFSTSCDFSIGKILANELLKIYLTNRIKELNNEGLRKKRDGYCCEMVWTASKRALVELIYALEAYGVFNKGGADIKTIAVNFEKMFNIDLGDFYHIYMEMKGRKINRTKFLDSLLKALLRKMDEEEN